MDFTCAECYSVSLELERLQREHGVEIEWRCLMLRHLNAAPMRPAACRAEMERRLRMAEHIRKEHGLVLKPGPIGMQTYAAHLAVEYARAWGMADALREELMRAYWLEGRCIGEVEVIKEIATEVGLDAADLEARFNEPRHVERVAADAQCAARFGVRRAPALVFANKYCVAGSQPAEVWRAVLNRVRAQENPGSGLELPAGLRTYLSERARVPVPVSA